MLKGSEEAATPLRDISPLKKKKGGKDRLVISNLAQKPELTLDVLISKKKKDAFKEKRPRPRTLCSYERLRRKIK